MIIRYVTSILLIFIFSGCSSWQNNLNSFGGSDEAISNSIIDFQNTSRNTENVYEIVSLENSEYIGVQIRNQINKIYYFSRSKDFSTNLPTNYVLYDDKLFFWTEEYKETSQEILSVLYKFDVIDSVRNIGYAEMHIDDNMSSHIYIYCKNNLLRYKHIKSKGTLGHHIENTNLDCK